MPIILNFYGQSVGKWESKCELVPRLARNRPNKKNIRDKTHILNALKFWVKMWCWSLNCGFLAHWRRFHNYSIDRMLWPEKKKHRQNAINCPFLPVFFLTISFLFFPFAEFYSPMLNLWQVLVLGIIQLATNLSHTSPH